MKEREYMLVSNLNAVLKDCEYFVKHSDSCDRSYFTERSNLENFDLLFREAWVNILLAISLRFINPTKEYTFSESQDGELGDGVILDKNNQTDRYVTEHVMIYDYDIQDANYQIDASDLVLERICKKISRGAEYAQGKCLVVFFTSPIKSFPTKIRNSLPTHNFNQIVFVGLNKVTRKGQYIYNIFDLEGYPEIIEINIHKDFRNWSCRNVVRGFLC